jgi:uncharacterized protein YecT (DUF1311 family)
LKYLIILLALFCANAKADSRIFSKEYQACLSGAENIEKRSTCMTDEIGRQKKRLNVAYTKVVAVLSPEDAKLLDKVQHDWLAWRDGNFNFISEHVPGEYMTTRITSLNFLLSCVYDRADDLESVLAATGH